MRVISLSILVLLLPACSDDTVTADMSQADRGVDAATDAATDGPLDPDLTDTGPGPDGASDLPGIDLPNPDATPTDGPLSDAVLQSKCTTLNTDYIATVQAAKVCAPVLPVVQCTQKVNDELACPCLTHVNQTNVQEVQKLQALQGEFAKLGCATLFACPAVPCPSPGTGVCQPSSTGTTGTCEDTHP